MIGKRIQTLRKLRGWSLTELSDRAGIAKSYLSMIERDKQHNPSIQVLEKLSAVLDVPMVDLLPDEARGLTSSPNANPFGLDEDWLQIAREAKQSGIDKEEFRQFLEYQRWRRSQQNN
ncbi:MAG: helix-turn-helix domain-containing protein [Alicyclobacillaceae bacterium]|uniref:helix-turn-helix domain-containing protein n=1 Tax=Alicyclobacillus sp. SP_1 TaxID=2942475 RepID=UPI0021582DA6|nr:helix-turn-helix domain-containing protein [Alicyclobacillus sp. SP_1]MCY0888081.1 helix-turn-helix domain-containing protein [Alicyclobacillaceae bacterium]